MTTYVYSSVVREYRFYHSLTYITLGQFHQQVRAYVSALQKYVPEMQVDMISDRYSGVRALAMDEDGMMGDFVFEAWRIEF